MVDRNIKVDLTSGYISGSSTFTGPLRNDFSKMLRRMEDPTEFLENVAEDFFKTNKQVVFSQYGGNSPFADLKERTKRNKPRPYPILVGRTKDLMASLTNIADQDAYVELLPKSLRVGTTIQYAKYLREGRPNMPSRDPVMIGKGRMERWLKMAENYITKVVKES